MKKNTRILLAEARTLVRAGLRALLETVPSLQVVGEVADSRELLRCVSRCRPDVVVMDAALPHDDALQAIIRLHRLPPPRIPVIVLSRNQNGEQAQRALEASASGYLTTQAAPDELRQAIRAVTRGGIYLSASLARGKQTIHCQGRLPRFPGLTRRQRQTLRGIAEGKNTKEIADTLGVSPKTIEFHRMQLMRRMKTRSIVGLVRAALRLGMVPDGPASAAGTRAGGRTSRGTPLRAGARRRTT